MFGIRQKAGANHALGSFTSVFPARFGTAPFHPEATVAIAWLMFGGFRFAPLVLLAALFEKTLPSGSASPLAPLLFMFFADRRRKQLMAFLRLPEAWAQVATVQACMWGGIFLDQEDYVSNFYVLLIPLIWTVTRFGVVGVVSLLVLIQTSVILAEYLNGYHPLSVFDLQLLLITLAITGLVLGVSIDEQRRTSADFRESLKRAAAGEMAAAITHEINQPLTAMSGYAKALQLIVASPQPDRVQLNDMLRKLVDESTRTADVVRRLRDLFVRGPRSLKRFQ